MITVRLARAGDKGRVSTFLGRRLLFLKNIEGRVRNKKNICSVFVTQITIVECPTRRRQIRKILKPCYNCCRYNI